MAGSGAKLMPDGDTYRLSFDRKWVIDTNESDVMSAIQKAIENAGGVLADGFTS